MSPEDKDTVCNIGYLLMMKEKRYREAIQAFDKIINIDPRYAKAWKYKGYALTLSEDYDNAIKAFNKAIEIEPDDAETWILIGNNFYFSEKYEEAIKAYNKAIEIKPDDSKAWTGKGGALFQLKLYEEAIKAYNKAIEIKPDDFTSWTGKAEACSKLKKYDEAIEAYDRSTIYNDDDAIVHNNYAVVLKKRGRYSEAESEVRAALKMNPSDPYFLGTLGDIFADEEFFKAAEYEYLNALNNSDEMEETLKSEIYNNLGCVYVKTGNSNKAKDYFNKAISFDPMNTKARRNLRAIESNKFQSAFPIKQKELSLFIVFFLGVSYYLFLIKKISETIFAAQSIAFFAFLIFIYLHQDIGKIKVSGSGIEIEMSSEHKLVPHESQSSKGILQIEQC